MRLSIERMHIENFKGTRDLTLDFAENVTHIAGMNGTGKTTIPDAFCWVLWNKDSHGNAPGGDAFREKPLGPDGREVHNLDTTVELFCKINGMAFNLRRTQRESWVKKRGSTTTTFQGNVSTYWINDVETPLKDFKARIAEIASEEVFRLIGSLSAFNALEWKKRRGQLIELADADVDAELLATDKYRPLADECATRNISTDDLRKVLMDQRRRVNTELSMIPVRIDEAKKAIPELRPHEADNSAYVIKDSEKSIAQIDVYIAEAKAESTKGSSMSQIVALEAEAASLNRRIADEWKAGKTQLERERDIITQDTRTILDLHSAAKDRKGRAEERIKEATEKRDSLRKEYTNVYSEKFQWADGERVCPTCGQPMPAEKVQEARETEEKRFNAEKKARLSEIKEKGTVAAADIERETKALADAEKDIAEAESKLKEAEEKRQHVSEALKAYPAEPDYTQEPRIEQLRAQIRELTAAREETPDEKIAGLQERRAELVETISKHRAILAKVEQGKIAAARVKELEAQQEEQGAKLVELDDMIQLAESYATDRCGALEESINRKFPTVRWKLFDIQINGGIADACAAMIPCDGALVPYESANTASQVRADVEIVNVLSEHYGVRMPLFVDNAERVNTLPQTDSQTITLSVSTDSELTVKE